MKKGGNSNTVWRIHSFIGVQYRARTTEVVRLHHTYMKVASYSGPLKHIRQQWLLFVLLSSESVCVCVGGGGWGVRNLSLWQICGGGGKGFPLKQNSWLLKCWQARITVWKYSFASLSCCLSVTPETSFNSSEICVTSTWSVIHSCYFTISCTSWWSRQTDIMVSTFQDEREW